MVLHPTRISIGSVVLVQLLVVTNGQTDNGNDSPHLILRVATQPYNDRQN